MKIKDFRGDPTDVSAKKEALSIGWITRRIIYFHYQKKLYWMKVSKKTIYVIARREALMYTTKYSFITPSFRRNEFRLKSVNITSN